MTTKTKETERYVWVEYFVPVVAEVDLETGRVRSVHVDDEEIGPAQRVTYTDARCDEQPDHATRLRAMEIADSAEWPEWEFGF